VPKGCGTALVWLGALGVLGFAVLGAVLMADYVKFAGMDGNPAGLSASLSLMYLMADGVLCVGAAGLVALGIAVRRFAMRAID